MWLLCVTGLSAARKSLQLWFLVLFPESFLFLLHLEAWGAAGLSRAAQRRFQLWGVAWKSVRFLFKS